VVCTYQRNEYFFGSFPTKDEAVLGNEAARRSLEPTLNDVLTPEGIATNVTLAKDAAHLAVHGTPDIFAGFDFTKTGVQQLASGNWKVMFYYQRKDRTFGTFATQDEAALVNEEARRSLELTRYDVLTTEEIQANIKQAKKVAHEAVEDLRTGRETV
jgi:hypothetical protein